MNTRNRLWGIITGIIIYISFAINANAQWQKIAKSVGKATCKQKMDNNDKCKHDKIIT